MTTILLNNNSVDCIQFECIEELEKQVSPSEWNPVKDKEKVMKDHVDFITKESQKSRDFTPCQLNMSTTEELPHLTMDCFGYDLPPTSPTFLWVHGGYWQFGCKEINSYFGQNFHDNGIRSFFPAYTIAPEGSIEEMIEEISISLKKVIQLCPSSKIYVGGHSAGAQIIAQLLLHSDLKGIDISGVFLFSGVYDLRPLVRTYVNDALGLDLERAGRLSPLLQKISTGLDVKSVEIKVIVGEYESQEFKRQSLAYAQHISALFPKVKYSEISGHDHFTLVESLVDPESPSFSTVFQTISETG